MNELLINITGTIIGGLFFTVILFLITEYIIPKKNISGEWIATITIKNTTYNKYKDMRIEFAMHLLQQE